jgi:acetyl esterase/lipase
MASKLPAGFTCSYKDMHEVKAELDLYLPPNEQEDTGRLLPSLVYFHGGGLTVGEKTSWFPFWIYGLSFSRHSVFSSSIPNR